MKRSRNKMTTGELAGCLGVAKQTVSHWIREKGWKMEKFPGVRGSRARPILVDTQACESAQNTPASHDTPMLMEAEEGTAEHAPGVCAPAYRQIINVIDNITNIEQERVAQLSPREEIRNFLACPDINESV